jgi:acetyl esterase/lipase
MTRLRKIPPLLRAVAFCLPAMFSGCAPVDILNATIDTDGVTIFHDVAFAPGARGQMDVYRPSVTQGALPVVVFFYGGSWQSGKRRDYLFVAAELARRGLVVVVPDYRLYPEVRFPSFLQDAAQAVTKARAQAPRWGGDPNRVFVAGHSAGAWIAAMLTLDPQWLRAAGDTIPLLGMAGLAGPYDFLPITGADIKEVFTPPANKRLTQPITFAHAGAPPMLLLHGDADTTVAPRNSISLAEHMRAQGGQAELKLYKGVGHIGIVISLAPLFRERAPALDDMARFFEQASTR